MSLKVMEAIINSDQKKNEPTVCRNSSHMDTVLENLQSLRKDELFCDVQFQTDDGTIISAHKNVLASASPYFHAMFTRFEESNKDLISMKDFDSTAFKLLMDFIYTGKIIISKQNVQILLPASNLLQLEYVKGACVEFLQAQLNPSNCLSIRALADLYDAMELLQSSEQYIIKHFLEVVKEDEFLSLTLKEVIKLISSNEINVPFEEKVFECVMTWVKHELDCRYDSLPELMEHVRLPFVTIEFLSTKLLKEPLLVKCHDFINKAISFQKHKKDVDFKNQQIWITPRKSYDLQKVILLLSRPRKSNKTYVTNWYYPTTNLMQIAPKIEMRHQPSTLVVIRNKYVLALGSDSRSVQLLDITSQSPSWVSIADMLVSRDRLGVGIINNCIYVVGGSNTPGFVNTAEVLNLDTLKWKMISKMSYNRDGVGVGVIDNLLYAVGGFYGSSVLKAVECYNPSHDTWTEVAEMSERRLGASVIVLDGILYAIGGHNMRETLKSVETFRPSAGVWTSIANMHVCRAFAGVFALDGLLYVVGGKNTYGILNSIEIYNPNTNIWSMVKSSTSDNIIYNGVVVDMVPNFRTNPSTPCYLF